MALSDNSFKDSELLGDLIKGSDTKICQISADGAYDCEDIMGKRVDLFPLADEN